MSKHILFIGGWTQPIQDALEEGYLVSYLGETSSSRTFDKDILKKCIFYQNVDIANETLCIFFAKKYHKIKPFNAVISFTEYGLRSAAIINSVLKTKGVEFNPTVNTFYKNIMREILDKHAPHISVKTKVCFKNEDINTFITDENSIIIKPLDGAGSTGVQILKSKPDIKNNMDSFIFPLLAEKFISSLNVYSIESISCNGKHYILSTSVSKFIPDIKFTIQNYILVPSILNNEKEEKIKNIMNVFLDSIDMKNGVAHTEIKFDTNNIPYIIESQTRVGGDRIWKMLSLTTSISQFKQYYNSLFHKEYKQNEFIHNGSFACFFALLPAPGIVKNISLPNFNNMKSIIEYEINIKLEDNINIITNNNQRKGYILIHTKNLEKLYETMDFICDNIEITYADKSIWHPSYERL